MKIVFYKNILLLSVTFLFFLACTVDSRLFESAPSLPPVVENPQRCQELEFGAVDDSFGLNGFVQIDVNNTDNGHQYSSGRLAFDPQGNIYVAGTAHNGSYNVPILLKLLPDGQIDSSFGEAFGRSGIKVFDLGSAGSGSALVYSTPLNALFLSVFMSFSEKRILKLDLNGNLDTHFGIAGYATTANITTADGLSQDRQGKLYITGQRANGDGDDLTATRFNSDGSVDSGFAVGGYLRSLHSGGEYGYAIHFEPTSDLFYMASGRYFNSLSRYSISRYTHDGTLDLSFGGLGTGNVMFDTTATEHAWHVHQSEAGDLFLIGETGGHASIGKLSQAGVIDTSFGIVSGKNVFNFNDGSNSVFLQIVESDLNLFGYTQTSGYHQLFLARLNSLGQLNSEFNSTGYRFYDFKAQSAVTTSVHLDANKRAVAFMIVDNGSNTDIGLMRICL